MRQVIQRLLGLLGYRIVRLGGYETNRTHLRRVLDLLAIDCVIDVGAHHGEFAAMMRAIGYEGPLVSFEPVTETFERLRARAAGDPRWRVRREALGSVEATREIHVAGATVFTSFRTANEYCRARFGPGAVATRVEGVPVRRLDAILDEALGGAEARRILLKIDTQGHDLDVLEGASGVLDRIAALQTEVPVKPIYEGVPTLPEVMTRVGALGFELTGAYPVTRDADGLRIIELDCVFRRAPAGGGPDR